MMDHTSTNILAALNEPQYGQADSSFSGSSFDGSSSYGASGNAYGSLDAMNFINHQSHGASPSAATGSDGLLSAVGTVDMGFGEPGFDVSGFTQEFVMGGTPAGEGDSVSLSASGDPVKQEEPPVQS